MKLATFVRDGRPRVGIVHGDNDLIFDLTTSAVKERIDEPTFRSMLDLIDAGPRAIEQATRLFESLSPDPSVSVPLSSVRLLAPLAPRQMRDAMNFPDHIRQAPAGMLKLAARLRGETPAAAIQPVAEVPEVFRRQPIFYFTNHLSVSGHDAVVHWPRYSSVMDFELEFGVIIGRQGRNIEAREGRQHIFGFTVFNDFSARDTQVIEAEGKMGPAKAKSFDGGNVLGPWITTADEIPDPYSLAMAVRVNGQTWANGSSSGMLHSFEEIIAHMTRDETLYAGEFIGSGTMSNGCGLELDRYLSDGDVVELEVEKIGVLRNRVVALRDDRPAD